MASHVPTRLLLPGSGTGAGAEGRKRKRTGELLLEDCRRLCGLDVQSPFRDARDAVDRLLPFHVLSCEDGGEADLRETTDGSGANLMCSRRESWEDICLQKAIDFSTRANNLRQKIESLDARLQRHARPRPEEDLLLEMFLSQDVNRRYRQERASSVTLAADTVGGKHSLPYVSGPPVAGGLCQLPHNLQAVASSSLSATWPAAQLGPLPSGLHRHQGQSQGKGQGQGQALGQQLTGTPAQVGVCSPPRSLGEEQKQSTGGQEQAETRNALGRSTAPLQGENCGVSAAATAIDPAVAALMAARGNPGVGVAGAVRQLNAQQSGGQGSTMGNLAT
eukprot:evm.model.scf_38EXC.11 EVM.evm.TU.scf_38EXC.11   scf_38EXC:129878-132162(+)